MERQTEFWSRRRVLVGGGCGFLGSYLVPELVARGATVRVVDNLQNADRSSLDAVGHQIELIEADLGEPSVCGRVSEGQDVVINLAAMAYGVGYSTAHHGQMLAHNLLCGLPLLEAARQKRVPRYVVMSTSCVYPDDAVTPTPELDTFEGRPEAANAGYGWAKRIQELAARYYAEEHGMRNTVVRPFNLYGANDRWESDAKAHVIPSLVRRVVRGDDPVIVWGSGNQRRNFLHGRDAARLLARVIERDPGPEPINLGFEEETSVRELVELICEVAGTRPRVSFDASKPEGRLHKAATSARLRQIIGEAGPLARISLREGILEMVDEAQRAQVAGT